MPTVSRTMPPAPRPWACFARSDGDVDASATVATPKKVALPKSDSFVHEDAHRMFSGLMSRWAMHL